MCAVEYGDGRTLAPYHQECMIIESRGKPPDRDVDVRVPWDPSSMPGIEHSNLIPPGCNNELSVVTWKLRNDKCRVLDDKHIYRNVPGKEKDKNYYLEEIETFLARCEKPGATIWYFGHSYISSGDWCFREGSSISFREIFNIYRRTFDGKVLTIVTDCPHSGYWPKACVEEMDRLEVPACGHKAKERGICIKVYASCCRNEIAREWYFATEGVMRDEDGRLSFGYKSDTQNPLVLNFSMMFCTKSLLRECQANARWKWKDMLSGSLTERVYLVRGNDRRQNRPAWQYVLVNDDYLEQFLERTKGGSLDVADYGQVLLTGWGKDPPEHITKLVGERLHF